jgi:hypothetical protein
MQIQAMLSQFHQKRKKDSTTDSSDDDDCDVEMGELLDDEDIEEEGEDEDEEEGDEELDLDREASDEAEIEELAREVEETHKLSQAQINHGRFSVTKVRNMPNLIQH